MLEAHPAPADDEPQRHFVWPRGMLLVIGLMTFAGMKGVMYDWCALYLKQEVHLSQDVAAIGYAAFTAAMAVARFGGDALRARYSERSLLRASAGLSAAAMAVVLVSGNAVVSIVGSALAWHRWCRSSSTPPPACPARAVQRRSPRCRRSATRAS